MKLFTVIFSFSDHLKGIGQYECESPTDALKKFIKESESLDRYDRDGIESAILGPIHIADLKGLWEFTFDPNSKSLTGEDNNPILGADVIQADPNAPARKTT